MCVKYCKVQVIGSYIKSRLTDLGDNPDQIAKSLLTAGYKGYRGSADGCPLARYFMSFLPGFYQTYWYQAHAHIGCNKLDYSLPAAVSEFVQRFDAGHYPYLEEQR